MNQKVYVSAVLGAVFSGMVIAFGLLTAFPDQATTILKVGMPVLLALMMISGCLHIYLRKQEQKAPGK